MGKDGKKRDRDDDQRIRPKNKSIKKKDKKKSRRIKDGVEQFLDVEASSGDDDEEHYERGNAADARYDQNFLKRKNQDMGKFVEAQEAKYQEREQRKIEKQIRKEKREKEIERLRREGRESEGSFEQSEEEPDSLDDEEGELEEEEYGEEQYDTAKGRLPTVNDPKLWQVRVKKGSERAAVQAILNKVIWHAQQKNPLSIISATSPENLENYIFVEAHKLESVKDALSGLQFVFAHKVDMLGHKEMVSMYDVSEVVKPEQYQWVRIKTGPYQMDIGLVDTLMGGDLIIVMLIPRINPNAGKPKDDKKPQKFSWTKNPQTPFNPSKLAIGKNKEYQKQFGDNREFHKLGQQIYRNGFVFRSFKTKEMDILGVRPSSDERLAFLKVLNECKEHYDDYDDEVSKLLDIFENNPSKELTVGDKILVNSGELTGTEGVVTKYDDITKMVQFKPTNLEDYEEILEVERQIVMKIVESGDAIKILDGNNKGKTGLVMSVSDDNLNAVVRIDISKEEQKFQVSSLKLINASDRDTNKTAQNRPTEMGPGKFSEANYKVGDVVFYDNRSKGRIHGYVTKAFNEQVWIMNEYGRHEPIKKIQISGIQEKQRTKLIKDSNNFAVGIEDVVSVINKDSNFFGQTGKVKDIITKSNVVFLWDKKYINQTNGIFVENANNVAKKGSEFQQQMGYRQQSGIANPNKIGKHHLVGKWVVIIEGENKGVKGRVTHVNAGRCDVETSRGMRQPGKMNVKETSVMLDPEKYDDPKDRNNRRNDQRPRELQVEYDDYNQNQVNQMDQQMEFGGKTEYGGNTTRNDAGMSLAMMNTPAPHQMNSHMDDDDDYDPRYNDMDQHNNFDGGASAAGHTYGVPGHPYQTPGDRHNN